MERGLAILGALSLAGLAAMQFARVDRRNFRVDETDTIEARMPVPAPVSAILHRACRDCHTDQTVWPWYSAVAPAHWLMTADVNTGREHMNLSRWGRYRLGEQVARLNGICDMVRSGKMPLWYYRPLHPSVSLSANDVAQLCAWTDSQSTQLVNGARGN